MAMRLRMDYLVLLLCCLTGAVSCSTIATHVYPDGQEVAGPYSGTAKAFKTLDAEDGFLMIPDIPLSLVADTIMLPKTLGAGAEKPEGNAETLPPQRAARLASARPKSAPEG